MRLLQNAVYNTLVKAEELLCESVSMPAISSGIFGFPKPLCAQVFFRTLKKFAHVQLKRLERSESEENFTLALKTVRLCNFDDETCEIFRDEFERQLTDEEAEALAEPELSKQATQATQGEL